MQDTMFSNQWYRVAKLQPRVRSGVSTHRHYYRGALWYIVGAKSSKSNLRINASAFYVFTQLDGKRTVGDIWQLALADLKDDAPSQDETLQLLSSLFDSGVIDFQRESDVDRLFDNHRRKQKHDSKSRYWNPLFLRFALFDPDRLAQKALPTVGWLFTKTTFYVWVVMIVAAIVAAAYSWSDLSLALNSGLVSPKNLMILWFVFPIMKLLHELAHAVAVKRWGGEVHEFGVALLVLLPVPYVDASDSGRFGNKYRRMSVAGAGVFVESTLACVGLAVWIIVEPGLVRDIAFNVLLTGSVSSLLFNGNPLLKFDSYYVLSDFIEVPNLSSRSNRYWLYLIRRNVFGISEQSPVTAGGERAWFVIYGLLATCYRLTLTIGICLFVAGQYFFVGVALSIWAACMQIGLPLWRALKFLLTDPRLRDSRLRAYGATAIFSTALAAFLFVVPMPNSTQVRGIVWPVDEAMVRAGADCLVEEVFVSNGERVDVGTELLRCETDLLEAEVLNLQAEQLVARAAVFATRDRVERGLAKTELDTATELLSVAEQNLAKTTISGSTSGAFFAPGSSNLVGNFFEQGAVIGYVLSEDNVAVRTMLDQEHVALVGDRLDEVEIRMVSAPDRVFPSTIVRRVPAATTQLVTPALGVEGGGDLVLDPEDSSSLRLYQPAFDLELQLPDAVRHSLVGEAVEVRFDHGEDTLAALLYRQLRLLFLRRFNV